jgi:N6-L-threonylcarbamoyladenine synthase
VVADSGLILSVESSCDETGIALIEGRPSGQRRRVAGRPPRDDRRDRAGSPRAPALGVPVLDEAWADAGRAGTTSGIAVTWSGPAGSLLVGINFAKAWHRSTKPLSGQSSRGPVYAAWLRDPGETERPDPVFPLVTLVVSGGHTFIAEMRDHLTYRCSARPSTTPPARPPTGGAPARARLRADLPSVVRRGRDPARPRLPASLAGRLVRPELLGA